jgi:NADH-quinone oxidoreductase subunit I
MDHDYELAVYDRLSNNLFNIEKLGKPVSYYASIRPTNYQEELDAKVRAKEEFERAQEEKARISIQSK